MPFVMRVPPQRGRVPVLPLGDSTTQDITDFKGYRVPLMKLLRPPYLIDFVGQYRDDVAGSVDQDHAGLSSDTLLNMNSRVVTNITAYAPKIVLLMGGINDMALGASPATTLTRLATLLATIKAADATIVTIVAMIPCDSANANYAVAQVFNAGVPTVVAAALALGSLVSYVDNFTGVVCGGGGVHPTVAGYSTCADRWYAGLLAYAPALAALNNPT